MTRKQAETILLWARTPGQHGGNPYCMEHVKEAEIALARIEHRLPETWAQTRECYWEKRT